MTEAALADLILAYQAGGLNDAAAACRTVLESEPEQVEATYLLGRILLDQHEPAAALSMLRKAVQLAPEWPEAHACVGAALIELDRPEEAAECFRRAAGLDPDDPEIRNNLGVALRAEGRVTEAIDAFVRAIELRPDYPDALANLGSALYGLGRYHEAADRFRRALTLDAANPELMLALGNTFLALGDYDAAEREFGRALVHSPTDQRAIDGLRHAREARDRADSVARWLREANELLARGENEAAETAFRQALLLCPADGDALNGIATALLRMRRAEEALIELERMPAGSIDTMEVLNNYGVALREVGRKQEAIDAFRRALALAPDHPNVVANLAYSLSDSGDADDAVPMCRRALEAWPGSAEMHNALGVALSRQGDDAGAAEALEHALRLDPRSAIAMMNLGALLCRQGKELRAVRPLRRALAIDPNLTQALNNLAVIYLSRGHFERGVEWLRRAIALCPNDAGMRFNLATALLAREQYAEGWAEYEHRLRMPQFAEPPFAAPKWRGESNPKGTLLVYSEQGFGDNLQFTRYLSLVKQRWQGSVVYCCYPELLDLFRASDLPAEVVYLPAGAPSPQDGFDAFVSLMSLPGLFGTVTESIPSDVPYLRAPKDRMRHWSERLGDGPELRVGIIWAGRRDREIYTRRTCDLSKLAPLAGIRGVRYYSIQTGPDAEQLADPPYGMEIVNLGKDLEDFADTAAIMQQLDLIMTIDTGPAHLAGALGRPAWLLLPFAADWRWLTDRDDSPWYPSFRLFRQPRFSTWEPVVDAVAGALRTLVNRRDGAKAGGDPVD